MKDTRMFSDTKSCYCQCHSVYSSKPYCEHCKPTNQPDSLPNIEPNIERQEDNIETGTLREFLKTLNVHNKDLDVCFNDALAERHLVDLIDNETTRAFHQGYSKGIDDARAIEDRSINREKVKARLIELDLLEQALNDGRDLQAYKLQRLEALEKESK